MHPIPLPTLQNAASGPFWAVLAVLRGLDVYAEGMSNGFLPFSWLNRLLDVFESAPVFDSYAQQVLRFRVLVL